MQTVRSYHRPGWLPKRTDVPGLVAAAHTDHVVLEDGCPDSHGRDLWCAQRPSPVALRDAVDRAAGLPPLPARPAPVVAPAMPDAAAALRAVAAMIDVLRGGR